MSNPNESTSTNFQSALINPANWDSCKINHLNRRFNKDAFFLFKFFKPKSMFTCTMYLYYDWFNFSLTGHSLAKFMSGNIKPNYLTHLLNRVKTCLVYKYFMTCTSLKMC